MSLRGVAAQGATAAGGLQDKSTGRIGRAIRIFREIGPSGVIALARGRGVRGSLQFALANIRHLIAHRLALRWDRRYGVDTAGSIQLDSLTIVGPNRDFGNEAVCTSPKSFVFMMQALPRDLSDCTFVDIGAGKSRTLLLASRHNFKAIVGVEFSRELVACARSNIASFKSDEQRCRNFDVVEADAAQYRLPDDPLALFFYNPFAQCVFDLVLGNIVSSLKSRPRDCYLIYASSSHNSLDWARPAICATGIFDELPARPMPLFFDAVRTIRYAVFRARSKNDKDRNPDEQKRHPG